MPKRICDWMEVEELAAHICGLDPDETNASEVEEALTEQVFNLENGCLEAFHNILDKIVPLIDIGESPTSGTLYRGFSRFDKDLGRKMWVVKTEITPDEL